LRRRKREHKIHCGAGKENIGFFLEEEKLPGAILTGVVRRGEGGRELTGVVDGLFNS